MDSTTDRAARPPGRPYLGHGVGLRVPHYGRALEGRLAVDWVEVISENFMRPGGRPLAVLERVRRDHPVVLHGVSLAIGSVAPLDRAYLARLRALADRVEPAWVSDHLCFGRVGPHHAHDLLPLPYTEAALAHVSERVAAVQDALGRPLVLENVSSYVAYRHDEMSEAEFLAELGRRVDCRLLVDLNNVVVSAANHGGSAEAYLAALPAERVWQLHLANHDVRPDHRFDSHRGAVADEVWALYRAALRRFGPVSTLVEWDEDIPDYERLLAEQRKAAAIERSESAAGSAWGAASHPGSGSFRGSGSISLAEAQSLFFDVIRWPTGARAFAAAHPDAARAIEATFADTPGFDRMARLEVYADAYFWRLAGVLREMFPRTARLLGDAAFHDLATDYVLACPSTDPDVGQVGARLPGFLATWPGTPVGAADLAAVEWAEAEALHGPDAIAATAADLAAIPLDAWPTLRLRAVPTARLVPCAIDAPAGHVLVWRRGFAVEQRAPSPAELPALASLVRGDDFATLCEAAGAAEAAAAHLARWVTDGLVSAPGRAAP